MSSLGQLQGRLPEPRTLAHVPSDVFVLNSGPWTLSCLSCSVVVQDIPADNIEALLRPRGISYVRAGLKVPAFRLEAWGVLLTAVFASWEIVRIPFLAFSLFFHD